MVELVGTGLKMASMMLSVVRNDSGFGLSARDRGEFGLEPPGAGTGWVRSPFMPNAGPAEGRREKDGRGRDPYGLFSNRVATPAITSPFRKGGDLYAFSPSMCVSSIVSCKVAFVLLCLRRCCRITGPSSAYSAKFR